jgi:mono/diheme cytochrome c family protein
MSLGLVIGLQLIVVGILLFAVTPAIRRRWPGADGYLALARSVTIVAGIAATALSLGGGQTPMSGTPNPVADQVTSVNAGYRLYQANCAACHGVDGNGGGPLAGTTEVLPPSLKAHLGQHTDGDLFYWIGNGLPGGMPAWSDKLSETDRWNLVNYLRSINGQGPTPDPSTTGAASVQRLGLLLPVGFATVFCGWLGIGIRRGRQRHR